MTYENLDSVVARREAELQTALADPMPDALNVRVKRALLSNARAIEALPATQEDLHQAIVSSERMAAAAGRIVSYRMSTHPARQFWDWLTQF